ncbi:hypothetical protein PAEAM_28450 [Paenibacillus sp. GM1FR]|nr:hypothetical protein [Paenibacillus sp. GM1FR]PJN59810.1 hypothetical protein PAEAM_28450 [Paenibacillus sp. GM1FR]
MTVAELIEIHKAIENPEKATILIKDTAAGLRESEYIDDMFENVNM